MLGIYLRLWPISAIFKMCMSDMQKIAVTYNNDQYFECKISVQILFATLSTMKKN